MKKSKLIIFVSYPLLFSFFFVSPALAADWVEDWISQKTVVTSNFIEGQKRGFYTPANVQMRWRRSNDYLVSVAKPKFETGCGGIDLFLGSFGFLNYENLVQKLQTIMGPAAATFAFDIALETLCAPCAQEIKSLEAIIDRLNQLQLDDCKAQKAVVATLKRDTGLGGPARTEAISDFIQSTGLSALYNEIVDTGAGQTADQTLADMGGTNQSLVAGCPAELKNTFFKPGSLLENLATQKYTTTNYVDLMRALVGDVAISNDLNYNYIPPCDDVTPDSIDDVINGELRTRDFSTLACTQTTSLVVGGSTYTSLKDWVYSRLQSYVNSLISKTTPTAEDEAFIGSIPGPILIAIQTEILILGEEATSGTIAGMYQDFATISYAYSTFNNLYDVMTQLFYTANSIVTNKKGTTSGSQQETCQLKLKDDAYAKLRGLQTKVDELKKTISVDYDKHANSFALQTQLANHIMETARKYRIDASKELAHGIKER